MDSFINCSGEGQIWGENPEFCLGYEMRINYLSEYVKKPELGLRGEFGSHRHIIGIYSQRTGTSMGASCTVSLNLNNNSEEFFFIYIRI